MKKLMLLLMLCGNLHAEKIEFVVSSGAGGPNDYISRKIAEKIENNSELNVVIYNKPGAGGRIAYDYIKQSNRPTIAISTSEISESDVYEMIDPIFSLGTFKNLVFVRSSDVNGIEELSKKDVVKFGHGGEGTFSHKTMVELCKKMNCIAVPFKSGSEGMLNVATGTIDVYALVGYGTNQFLSNKNYKVIGEVTLKNNWIKLFGKNLPPKDKETIKNILKNTDKEFFREMNLNN